MTSQQRHELYLALMTHEALAEDIPQLAEMAVEDVERLEPVIDEMLKLAFDQGRMQAYLETWAKHEERWRALKKDALQSFA